MPERCRGVLAGYRPYDAERGRHESPRDVSCTLDAGHDGFHHGDDGMPFGPHATLPDGGDAS